MPTADRDPRTCRDLFAFRLLSAPPPPAQSGLGCGVAAEGWIGLPLPGPTPPVPAAPTAVVRQAQERRGGGTCGWLLVRDWARAEGWARPAWGMRVGVCGAGQATGRFCGPPSPPPV